MVEDKVAILDSDTGAHSVGDSEKRTYTVDEIQEILGIGRNSAYSLVKSEVFHSVRFGGTIRISKKSFDEWLDKRG